VRLEGAAEGPAGPLHQQLRVGGHLEAVGLHPARRLDFEQLVAAREGQERQPGQPGSDDRATNQQSSVAHGSLPFSGPGGQKVMLKVAMNEASCGVPSCSSRVKSWVT